MRNLEKKSILKSETRGKIKIYKITPSFISREYLLLTENYKKIAFLEKNIIIKEIVEKIESYMGKFSKVLVDCGIYIETKLDTTNLKAGDYVTLIGRLDLYYIKEAKNAIEG